MTHLMVCELYINGNCITREAINLIGAVIVSCTVAFCLLRK